MSIKRALVPVALVFPLLLYAYDVKDKDDLQPTDSLLHDTGASQLSVKQLIVPASLVAYGIFEAAMMHGNRMLNYSKSSGLTTIRSMFRLQVSMS